MWLAYLGLVLAVLLVLVAVWGLIDALKEDPI